MALKLTQSPAWLNLLAHYADANSWHMRDLFAQDEARADKYHINAAGIHFDYSKNIINEETIQYLLSLLEQQLFSQWQTKLFDGEKINHTENRAAMHAALRQQEQETIEIDGEDIVRPIRQVQQKMQKFVHAIHTKEWCGSTGKSIDTVVNIGIGGSDLGPKMVVNALQDYQSAALKFHFVSNIDPVDINDVLAQCDPETTLFIVVSKTFTTIETVTNTKIVQQWMRQKGFAQENFSSHFVAVTNNIQAATTFGISEEAVFSLWDWVGGRFSLWSSVGLSIMLAIGVENFEALLQGAAEMDKHFRQAKSKENMPIIMALLGVWYNNFFNAQTYAILPYSERLSGLVSYLQQADMESNGKSVDREGKIVDYQTGPIIWGAAGTNGQHAFYQLMHQGTKLIPCDFIAIKDSKTEEQQSQRLLNANFIAQMEALMLGKSLEEVKAEPHKTFVGNKPSNAIVMEELSPANLGALIALYEHKVFVQGVIWGINSYDQWGVEYGKQLAKVVYASMKKFDIKKSKHDSSTRNLISQLS